MKYGIAALGHYFKKYRIHYSMFDIRYSLFDIRYSLFDIRFSMFLFRFNRPVFLLEAGLNTGLPPAENHQLFTTCRQKKGSKGL